VEAVQSEAAASDGAENVTSDETEDELASCGGQSFSPNTEVTLADGREIPISRVKVGDMVLATDTTTGITKAERVTALWVNRDTDLMDVTVNSSSGSSTINSTEHHLFWDLTTYSWTQAENLTAGDILETPSGAVATVVDTAVLPGAAYMWDLTVDNDHDFYVALSAGSPTSVLVHNCPTVKYDPEDDGLGDDAPPSSEPMKPAGQGSPNDVENQQAQYIAQQAGLDEDQATILHRIISNEGYSIEEIQQIARDIASGQY
jgi:hypothetical protein